LKPAWANSSRDPILKIPISKTAGGMTQGEGPEFKPQTAEKEKNVYTGFQKLSPVVMTTFQLYLVKYKHH
jgi:hypothetical protein